MRAIRLALATAILLAALLALYGCGSGGPPPRDEAFKGARDFTTDADGNAKVLITFKTPPGAAERESIRQAGGKVHLTYRIVPGMAASVPPQALEALERNPNVLRVEPDGECEELGKPQKPPPSGEQLPWGVDQIDAELVHPTNKGANVKVAVLDGGIDYNHLDLKANYVAGGYDFANGDNDPMDDNGHGTHCAGTIAAEDNEIGVIGVAPEADLYAVKVLGGGSGQWSWLIAGLDWCVTNGMQVASMSLGGSSPPTLLKDACDNAYNAGIVLVAAAGNNGSGTDTVGYPAKYDSVIAVAATDKRDRRASFSSTGPAVDVAAPGVDVLSTILNNQYGLKSGTSMACPHVSGTVALLLAANPTRTPAQVRQRLIDTALDLRPAGWDSGTGWGRIQADNAVGVSGLEVAAAF
ncbi:MAG: S8 family peptidase [Armatimonadetes bacterium]|nr:S8 family peptidase [Armatimonadota bacterium]